MQWLEDVATLSCLYDIHGRRLRVVYELQLGCEEQSVNGRCPGLFITVAIWIAIVEASGPDHAWKYIFRIRCIELRLNCNQGSQD